MICFVLRENNKISFILVDFGRMPFKASATLATSEIHFQGAVVAGRQWHLDL